MKRTVLALFLILAAAASGGAPRKESYIVDATGRKQRGVAVEVVNAEGDLKLNVDGRGGPVFKRGTYRYAFIPKPPEVAALEKAYKAGNHQEVLDKIQPVFDAYKYVGWGDMLGYLEGMCRIAREEFTAADAAFRKGQDFALEYTEELTCGRVLAAIGENRVEKVGPVLDNMVAKGKKSTVAFAFNTKGKLLEKEGKKKEAVLEYMKTLLLFDNDDCREQRDEARTRAVAILKDDLKDPRWQEINDLK